MKKIFLLLAILIAGFKSAPLKASGTPLAKAEIITKESINQNGILEVQVRIKTTTDVFFASEPSFILPKGWAVKNIHKLKKTKCKKDGPVIFTFLISYPKTNLPFFPQEISGSIKVESETDSASTETIFVEGRIYFTPYKTVEVWSAADFHNSKRVWLTEGSTIETTRIYIPKSSIPKTNIPKNHTMQALWEDDYTLKRVEGLAYSIPMLAIHPDSIAKYNNDDLPIGVEPDSLFENTTPALSPQLKVNSARKIRLRRRFKGTVSGRLVTHIINDLGQHKTIPLAGVNILLKEYDWYANETFAEVHTGSDGYFSFTYNEDQSFAEGKTITLFLKYKSRNATYDIKVKEHSVFGGSYEETTWLGNQGQNVSLNLGEVYLDNDAYKPLHYAVRAWQFSNNNGIHLRPDLTILAYQSASYFLPDGAGGISSPITRPTIRLGDGDENDENTLYHEFGHFFQWNVQDKNYATPIFNDKSGEHAWDLTNTSRAAWTEGWADAFQMILDAAYWYEDVEYAYERGVQRALYENRDSWNIANGMESEYYIACAIYDLWDGDNKGLPNTMPKRAGGPNIHGYNDQGNSTWKTVDNVQLSFNQIVSPMRINSSASTVIGNIYTYYSLLVSNVLKDDCNLISDVARCFNENRVVEDAYNVGFNTGMSSDGIGRTATKTFNGELLFLGTDMTYTDTYLLNNFSGVLNNHIGAGQQYYITDPIILDLGRVSRMELNINSGAYYTCSGTDITVKNGKLGLGGGTTAAEIQINENSILKAQNLSNVEVNVNGKLIVNNLGLIDLQSGSTTTINSGNIVVRSGGTLYIRALATLNLLGTSKIIVEPGGFICIPNGATINVSGPGKLELNDGANIGTNPLVITSSDCRTDICFGSSITFNTDALDFDGIDDYVEVKETNGSLNLGINDFTFEAIFKSDPIGVANNIQILASKRNDFNVPPQQTDGFMWGIWPDGHIYAQLGGTPNIGYDQGPSFLDGSCHHVALTRQGSLITFYNDGIPYYTYTLGARNISSTGSLRIGRNHFSNVPFDGLIGEVRIWDVARTALEIQNNIGANLLPQDGLIGYWDMTGQSSQFLTDLSGNNNIGILGNSISCSGDISDPIWVEASMLSCNAQGNFRKGEYTKHDSGSESNTPINIYPNPFINEATINLAVLKTYSNAKITIINCNGIEVFNKNIVDEEDELQFGGELTKGVYFVKLTSDGFNKAFKLVKN